MRLVEFAVAVLTAHASTLGALASLLGDTVLLEVLEAAGEKETPAASDLDAEWFDPPHLPFETDPYQELEGSVRELQLPEALEFHIWAYPYYRKIAESSVDFSARIRKGKDGPGVSLIDQAVAEAEAWIRSLPLPPDLAEHARRASHIQWLRFRTDTLKRIGRRPIGPVY